MMTTERQTSGDEPFVLVDGTRPSEAEHVYDHFFSEYNVDAYTPTLVQQVHARRARPELNGRLFFDELLSMALEMPVENVKSAYPPSAGKEGLVTLIERISSSSFDRIRRTALLFYLLLDMDEYNGSKHGTTRFAERFPLPRSARHAMMGYWNMDNGKYRVAVSYLEQPDFVPRFLEVLSPLRTLSTSAKEAKECAYAFSAFLKLISPSQLTISNEFKEAQVVSICYNDGVRAAWLRCQELIAPSEDEEEEEREMMRCVSRIVEYCFMPQPKATAVQSLIALPLSMPEEALLADVIVNPPPNVNLSASAHAKAIDVLLIRYINSGQYVEAVLLDRRVNASLGLMHLTGNVKDEVEREKLHALRTKRQSLVKAAYSVLTNVERTLLRLGEEVYAEEREEEGSESSWERIPTGQGTRAESVHVAVAGDASVFSDAAGSSRMTPLTASPNLRRSGQTSDVDPLLAAIARSRLQQVRGSPLSKSVRGSPTQNVFAASPLVVGDGGPSLRDSNSSTFATPVPPTLDDPSVVGDTSFASPLANKKPYKLGGEVERKAATEASKASTALLREDDGMSTDVDQPNNVREAGEDVAMTNGPMAQLAQQIEEEMRRNHGAVDEILSKSSPSANVSPFRVVPRNAQSTLAFTRTPRRYEARYEIGSKANEKADVHGDAVMNIEAPLEQHGESAAALKEVARRRQTRRAPASNVRARKTKTTRTTAKQFDADAEEDQNDGDTSVPGSFPEERETDQRTRKGAEQEEEDTDVVPEMTTQTPNVRRSRSAAGGLTTKPKASTPLRRSSRLSVEPDAQAMEGESEGEQATTTGKARAGKRTASPSKGAGKKATTAKTSGVRTTRATSQAPSDVTDDAPMMTRSSSRRKTATSSNVDAIPGAF